MEEIRARAIERVHAGESPETVIKTLGFSRACIYNWLARYRSGGWHAMRTGDRSGRPKKLDGAQIKWISKTIRDKNPLQLKFEFALWTRSMIVDLIKSQFGIKLSTTSVGRLLAQLGFTCQKPALPCLPTRPRGCNTMERRGFPTNSKTCQKRGSNDIFPR